MGEEGRSGIRASFCLERGNRGAEWLTTGQTQETLQQNRHGHRRHNRRRKRQRLSKRMAMNAALLRQMELTRLLDVVLLPKVA